MTKSTQFKDKRRRYAYDVYNSSYDMWKKAHSISSFLLENSKKATINPVFIENVRSFIGELEGLKRYNDKNISRSFNNKCCLIVIPHLKNIVSIYNKQGMTMTSTSLIRHEITQIETMTNKMMRRFSKMY